MKRTAFAQNLNRALLSGVGLAALWGGVAQAQSQMVADTEVVTVTGSRIPRSPADLPSPVVSVSALDLQNSGTTNVGDYLQRIPALVGSYGDYQTTGYNTLAGGDGSSLAGLNLLDLRNLGYIRTLVLIDGHRSVGEATSSAAVDVNTIPITLIDRIDVDTAGDSAVYGADGVSGVVNFIMKHDLEGVHAHLQAGMPQGGGAGKYITAISAGHNFDDGRGNITITWEGSYQDHLYYTQRPFTRVGGRSFFVANPDEVASGVDDPNVPDFIPTRDAAYITSAPTGAIQTDFDPGTNPNGLPNYLGNGQVFNVGRDVGNFSAIGSSGMPYAVDLQSDFIPLERRNLAQISGHYDFADWFKLSAEFKFAGLQTKDTNQAPFDDFAVISSDNAYLPANVAMAVANSNADVNLGLAPGQALLAEDYLALIGKETTNRETYRSVIGAQGNLLDNDWISNLRYDFSYTYGQTDVDDIDDNNRITDRFFAALDSVKNGAGQAVCRSNLNPAAAPPDASAFFGPNYSDTTTLFDTSTYPYSFTPGPNSGCLPFNPFDPNASQAGSIAWITAPTHVRGSLVQHVINGFFSADFKQFQDWGVLAAPLSVVLGGEYRKEMSSSQPDALSSSGDTYNTVASSVKGEFDVSEVFAEINATVLKDAPFAKELSVNLAGRQSHYSTAGDNSTWKVSLVWQPIDQVRFRGTEAYAVRAPNIGELFSAVQQVFSDVDDPCDHLQVNNGTSFRVANCTALENGLLGAGNYNPATQNLATGAETQTFVGGNAALKPESARTSTFGIVLTPLDKLVITADWYNVSISQAIQALDAQTIAEQCVDLNTLNNPFCAQVVRYSSGPFAGSIKSVSAQQINVASFVTSGLDYSIEYHASTQDMFGSDYGTLGVKLTGNWLDKLSFTSLAGQAPIEGSDTINGGFDDVPAPKWQNNLDLNWNWGAWAVNYNIDWYDGVFRDDRVTLAAQPDEFAPQYIRYPQRWENDVQVSYQFDSGFQTYVGINNLFYQKPAIGSAGYPVSPLGRFFYVGINADTDYDRLGL